MDPIEPFDAAALQGAESSRPKAAVSDEPPRTLRPPEWIGAEDGPRSVASLSLERYGLVQPVARQQGPRAELASLAARVRVASRARDAAGERAAATSLARALAARGTELDEATRLARRALLLGEDPVLREDLASWFSLLGEPALAASTLEPLALARGGAEGGACWLRIGALLCRAGEARGARAALEQALALVPDDPAPAELLGAIGAWAEEVLPRETAAAYYLEASSRRERHGDRAGAIEALFRAFEIAPESAQAAERLASSLTGAGRVGAADEIRREHAKKAGASARATHLRRLRGALRDGDWVRALGAAYDAGLDAELDLKSVLSVISATEPEDLPGEPTGIDGVFFRLGLFELLAARLELACDSLAGRERARAWRALARLHGRELGRADRALDAWVEAFVADPDDDESHEALMRYAAAARDPLPLCEALLRVLADRQVFSARPHLLRELATLAAERLDDPRLYVYALERLQASSVVEAAELERARELAASRDSEVGELQRKLAAESGAARIPLLELFAEKVGAAPEFAETRLASLLELSELSPSEWRHQKAAERLLIRQQRHEELAAFYDRLSGVAPSALERARFKLAKTMVLRRRGNLDGAIAELSPLLDDSPPYLPALCLLAFFAAERRDELLRARALSRLSAGVGPVARAVLLAVAGESLLGLGELEAARELVDLAVAADPSSARALSARAAVGSVARDAWGLRAMERALSVIAPRAELCAALSDTCERLGEPLLAVAFSQRWVALRPGDARASADRLERARRAADGALLADAIAHLLSQPQPVAELALPVGRALMALSPLSPMRAAALSRRALDVIGPRALDLRLAVLAVAEVTGERGLAITALERWLGSGALGSSRAEILLDLARRRRNAGDADGAARALMRATGEGAWGTAVLAELDSALPARSSDGQIALLAARAEALGALGESDQRGTARAFRDLGAAYWDLASDPLSAFAAWERAVTLDPVRGVESYASDLLAFAGADAALNRLEDLARRRSDRREAARVLVVAATLSLELGRSAQAFSSSSRALELDPTRTDVLGVVERAAGEGDIEVLDRVYQLLAEATLGRFGERSAHYRAARQMERRGALPQALAHAVRAFELVPSEGVLFVTMARLGERIGEMTEVVAAIERVADASVKPGVRAAWLQRAALLAGSSEQGLLQRVEILLRALSVRPDSATLSGLSRALGELLPRLPAERDTLELRVTRAVEALLARVEGPDGARLAVQCAELLIRSFDAVEFALSALGRGIDCDAGSTAFLELLPLVPRIAAAAGSPLDRIAGGSGENQAGAGAALLQLGAALAQARGEATLGVRLLVQAARSEPEDAALVERAEREARAFGDPELIELVLDAIPASEQARTLIELAEAADSPREAADYLDRALLIDGLPSALEADLRQRLLGVFRRGRLIQRLVPALEQCLDAAETGEARAQIAVELGHLLAERGEYQRAIRLLEREIPNAPHSRELFETLAAIARASNEVDPLAGALSALVELARGTAEELGLLRELAELFQQAGDRTAALMRWEEVLALDPSDLAAIAGVEREAERRGDYERLAELLGRRAALARSAEEVRAVRLRRATVLEQRLGRAEDARAELEGLLAVTGDSLSALRMLADLHQRLGAPLSSAPLWLRASGVARDPQETVDLVHRACEAYLQGGDFEAAGQALAGIDTWAQSEATLELAVEVGRRRDDPLALSLSLDRLAELSTLPLARRVALWLEAARASLSAGADEAALRRAQSAAKLDPSCADAQLLVLSLEYRRKGRISSNDAETTVALLRRLGEKLPPEQLELRAFLLAEALDLTAGSDAALTELDRTQRAIGARPLLALGLAERLADRGESARALDAYDLALSGDLSALKNSAEVAMRAAKLARAIGDLDRAALYLECVAKDPAVRERARKLSDDVLAERTRSPGSARSQSLDPGRGLYSQRPVHTLAEDRIALPLAAPPVPLISEAPGPSSGPAAVPVTIEASVTLPPGRYSARPSVESMAPVLERRFSTEPPPLLRDPHENALHEALLAGDFEAGRALIEHLERAPDRARDTLLVSRRFSQLHPGDRFALEQLHRATLREGNAIHAEAIAHVLAVLDPHAEPVRPPALSDVEEQPEVVRSLILRDLSSRALEAFALVWEGAEHVFRRDASTYGVTGLERIPPGSPTPLARCCAAAARALGLSRTPLFQRRSAGSITVSLALLAPPAIVVSGDVRHETPELGFHLGAMLLGTLPQFVLLFGSSEAQARAVLAGLRFAFGPPQAGSNSGGIPSLAEILWESIPVRLQRQLRELCDDPTDLEYEGAIRIACSATRRAGLFVCGDLGVALREACLDEQIPLERLATGESIAELARSNASIRSLVQMAISLEYAETRWCVARHSRQSL